MKKPALSKGLLLSAITLMLSRPALAVTDEEFNELQQKFDILAEQVEANSGFQQNVATSDTNTERHHGHGTRGTTTVGGYGELHYNNLSSGIAGKDDKKELDFHRFVLFFGHEFSDKARFFSELEVEHGTIADTDDGSSPGSVAIEQAYVQLDLSDSTSLNAGIFLVPVGFINEVHEPPRFYGVERPVVTKYILPTTWREGGVGLVGNSSSGLSYDIYLHSGLSGGTDIRGGRQKVAEAKANNLATTGRIKYTGINGLELAATLQYQDDMTQDTSDAVGSATLAQAQVRWQLTDLTLTALYGQWNIDVAANGTALDKARDNQAGGYLEASYKINPRWGVFARHSQWDNGPRDTTQIGQDTVKNQTDFGFNYWPHEDVVLKADYQVQNDVAGDYSGFNLGVGYQF